MSHGQFEVTNSSETRISPTVSSANTYKETPSVNSMIMSPTTSLRYYSMAPDHPPFGEYFEVELDEQQLKKALETKNFADGTEEQLYRTLLNPAKYEKDVRPTTHHTLPTNVTFGFLLNQIVEMDERNQVLTTRSWLNINWLDQRLVWNHTEWGGIKTIYIPHQRLWKPDIILVNNAIREYHASLVSTDIMATSDGNVTWLFSALFRSSCPIRVRYYPFDDQECDLKFASWSHDISEIDLKLNTDKGDLSSYMNNSEFDLLDMIAIRETVKFPSDTQSYWPTIVIRIQMHRRPLFYVFNHIIPCVLISSMAVLGFLMPPETGEKINMIITTLLSMGVYLQSITESIPPTSEAVPLIGMYYVSSLFMVCLATCVNVITLNMHRNGAANQGRHVPVWMEKYILGYLASIMRMTIREPDSIALLKTAQSRKSTIRRSSILRDLKRVKNFDNKRGIGDNSRTLECECMGQLMVSFQLIPSLLYSLFQVIFKNFLKELRDITVMPITNHNAVNGGVRTEGLSESAFIGRIVGEQIMPRMSARRPLMLTEFENRFRKILKRIYRSLQQHEIREEILDERQRIQWQWQQLASVVDRLLLLMFSFATLFTITFFLVLPVGFRDEDEKVIKYN
uniref:Ligand-gated ion channel 4 n=1 Tax=Heterorhabditis bacteriophora TaxID=37862 RepID=A0A1I7X6B9_HETBA